MVHVVLLSGSVLDDVQQNVDRRFTVLGCRTVSTASAERRSRRMKPSEIGVQNKFGYVSVVSGTPRRSSYRTGTLRTTDFAPCTASTAVSPSRFVFP